MITKDSLWIVAFDKDAQKELSGIVFYGAFQQAVNFDNSIIKGIWNGFADVKDELWHYDNSVCSVPLIIRNFPSSEDWELMIKETLVAFITLGSSIAWCGDESCYANLNIFDPEQSSGNVYSSLLRNGSWFMNSSLNDEIAFLDDEQLMKIKVFLEQEGFRMNINE